MQESWAYPTLYQDHGNRATDDLSILILQGRSVGGGTTVNWTASFRTPPSTLALWARRHAVHIDEAALAPHFAAAEQRLAIPAEGVREDVNRNNLMLWQGAEKLGWGPQPGPPQRQAVRSAGLLRDGLPDRRQAVGGDHLRARRAGRRGHLYANCRVRKLERERDRITTVVAEVLDEAPDRPRGPIVTVRPRRGVLVAGGAINTPALLLQSGIGSDSGLLGKRTFLHPTVPIVGIFPERIEGFYGPPLSVSCHHFADRGERDVGYFLEVSPIHPMLGAIAFPGFGDAHRAIAQRLPFCQATIALLIDGQRDDAGGTVSVSSGGRVSLHYPLAPGLREAGVHALGSMARLLLAAGASEVISMHDPPVVVRTEADLGALARAPFGPHQHTLFSAHQMGGCAMGEDPGRAVVNSRGRHHQVKNLWVVDGSVFPTSLGVNPQLSIYGHARLFATEIARGG